MTARRAFTFGRRNKFSAQRTNGFSSKLESAVHDILLSRQKSGEISEIKCQQTVVLQEGARDVRIAWKVDFSFVENTTKQLVYAEAKGIETMDYKIKLKLWRKNPPAPLEIYKGHYSSPKLVERIEVTHPAQTEGNG